MDLFPCKDGCSNCCKNLGGVIHEMQTGSGSEEMKEEYRNIAGFVQVDGSCKFLKDGKCRIYRTRPTPCNSELMWKKYFRGLCKEAYQSLLDLSKKAMGWE